MGFWPKLALSLMGGLLACAVSAWGGYSFRDARCEAQSALVTSLANEARLADSQNRTQATMASALKTLAERERIETVTRTIVQKVPVYVPKEVDRPVNLGFVRLFNASAGGYALPDTAPGDNATASSVALSAVAGTAAEDLGLCHANAAQLVAAQDWIRAQIALNPKTK